MAKIRKVGQLYQTGPISNKITIPNTNNKSINFLQIGIQGLPGTEFSFDGTNQITIGNTGIYEINFENFGITVNTLSISANKNYDSNDYLIVDYIYEEEEA